MGSNIPARQKRSPGVPRVLKLDTADKVQLAICKEHTSEAAAIIPRGTAPTPFAYFWPWSASLLVIVFWVLPVICYADSHTCVRLFLLSSLVGQDYVQCHGKLGDMKGGSYHAWPVCLMCSDKHRLSCSQEANTCGSTIKEAACH